MTALELALALGSDGTLRGKDYTAHCPAHEDSSPSLSISQGEKGEPIVHCFSGCDGADVVQALKDKGLWPKKKSKEKAPPPWKRPIEAIYEYKDKTGATKYQNIRFSDSLSPRFMPRHQDPDNAKLWKWNLKGIERLLFNFTAVLEAKKGICIVEGEKDVINLSTLGFTVTTAGAAGVWFEHFNESFKGKEVCILADNDSAGKKHADTLAKTLFSVASTIRVVELPNLKKKGDISDWIKAGGTRQELISIMKGTKVYELKSELIEADHEPQDVGFIDWPHAKGNGMPLQTIQNIKTLVDAYNITCRYNVIRKALEINIPNQTFTIDNKSEASMNHVSSLAEQHRIPTSKLERYILNIADKNSYNPAADWIASKSWDGKDRIEALAESLGANDIVSALKILRKWLISGAAAAFEVDGVSARGVLVLQGAQHTGKTSWFWSLLGNRKDLGLEGATLNPTDKDSVKNCVSRFLVELGELDSTLKKSDISNLKSFLGKKLDEIRLPYARSFSLLPRRTIFMGTVNDTVFLHDTTGSTRFWVIPITKKINPFHGIDMQQVWAQARYHYDAGEKWNFDRDDIEWLEGNNEKFKSVSPMLELIVEKYDMNVLIKSQKTATRICIEIGYSQPTRGQTRECGVVLRELFGEPKRTAEGQTWDMPEKVYVAGGV